jgi:hypothetical protein
MGSKGSIEMHKKVITIYSSTFSPSMTKFSLTVSTLFPNQFPSIPHPSLLS